MFTLFFRLIAILVVALSGALLGCGGDDSNLPKALPCSPDLATASDPSAGASFNPGHMLCVQVQMPQADFDRLRVENRFGVPEDEVIAELLSFLADKCTESYPAKFNWYTASVSVDGAELEDVGIRKKGFLGSVAGDGGHKPSIKLKTDKHTTGQLLGGTERLTLNNNLQDATRMRTCLAYQVFTAAGHPAPRCNLANVMLNDKPLGAYVHVESVKKRLVARLFGDNKGSLYEGTIADFTSDHLGQAAAGELGRWDPKTSDTDPKGAALVAIQKALEAPDEELETALGKVCNIDKFIRFWALETFVGHTDGYTSNRNNFYVYFDPTDGDRAVFIPWGTDNVFGDGGSADGPFEFSRFQFAELPRRFSRIPSLRARYELEVQRILDDVWDEEAMLSRIETWRVMVATAQDDPTFNAAMKELRKWVEQRRSKVVAALLEGVPAGDAEPRPCSAMPGGALAIGGDALEWMTLFTFAW
jgi:spore coat protein H